MQGPLQWLGFLLIRFCCWVPAPLCPSREKGQERPGDIQPRWWHPIPCGRWVPGNRKPGFLESWLSRPHQIPGFPPACPEPSAPFPALLLLPPGRGCCQPHAAPTTQGSCSSPPFIYFLESFFNTWILLLVSLLKINILSLRSNSRYWIKIPLLNPAL